MACNPFGGYRCRWFLSAVRGLKMLPRPPNLTPFSVAGIGSRITAGKAGRYRKTECKAIIDTSSTILGQGQLPDFPTTLDADGNTIASNFLTAYGVAYVQGVLFGFEVECPSARIRVAFGVCKNANALEPQAR